MLLLVFSSLNLGCARTLTGAKKPLLDQTSACVQYIHLGTTVVWVTHSYNGVLSRQQRLARLPYLSEQHHQVLIVVKLDAPIAVVHVHQLARLVHLDVAQFVHSRCIPF